MLLGSNDSSPINLDIDGDGETDALSDGLLIIKYLLGSTGNDLTGSSFRAGATRTAADEIVNYLDSASSTMLDVDGNGEIDALTDGLLILRYLFEITGDALISGALGAGATRTTTDEIEAFLSSFDLPVASQLDNLSFGSTTVFLENTAIF